MESNSLTFPVTHFNEPEDEHDIVIPEGYAAIRVAPGQRIARVDLCPGTHRLNGVSFDDIDVPFAISVIPEDLASIAARSDHVVDEYRP